MFERCLGGVPVLSKLAKSGLADDCKVPGLQLLLNVVERPEVQEQLVSSGGISALVKLLKAQAPHVVQLASTVSTCSRQCSSRPHT